MDWNLLSPQFSLMTRGSAHTWRKTQKTHQPLSFLEPFTCVDDLPGSSRRQSGICWNYWGENPLGELNGGPGGRLRARAGSGSPSPGASRGREPVGTKVAGRIPCALDEVQDVECASGCSGMGKPLRVLQRAALQRSKRVSVGTGELNHCVAHANSRQPGRLRVRTKSHFSPIFCHQ